MEGGDGIMKFTTGKSGLLNVLNTVGKSIGGGMIIATNSYRFKMDNQQLVISACNLETSIEQPLYTTSNDEDFDVLIPSSLLRDYIKSIPADQPLTFSFERTGTEEDPSYNISIKEAGENGCVFVGYPGRDFPCINVVKPKTFEMDYSDLYSGLYATELAMPPKDDDNKMSVIHMEMSEAGTSFTGFDGSYLVNHNVPAKLEAGAILIPSALVSLISSMPMSGMATIQYSSTNMSITVGKTVVKSRLKDGTFYDWRPGVHIWEDYITFEREAFIAAAKQALIFASKHNHQLAINISGTRINIVGQDIDFNHKSEQCIPCSEHKGDFTVGVDGSFILKLLSRMAGNECFLHFISPMRFLVFKDEDKSENFSLLAPQKIMAQ